ncbi:MAG: extracellular solute-binding protein [Propionicimonas sp.]
MKKHLMPSVALAIAAALLTACQAAPQPSATNGQPGSTDGTPASTDQLQLRVMTRASGTDASAKVWAGLIKDFEAANPTIDIIDESISEEQAYNDKLNADMASGNLPALFRIQGVASLRQYIEAGLLMDVTPILQANPDWAKGFQDGSLSTWQYDGIEGSYGVPMEMSPMGFFYNKKLFQQAGISQVPETWDEFKDACKKLVAAGIQPIALGAKDIWRAGHLHNAMLYRSVGVQKAKDLGARTAKWTDPDVVATFQLFADLKDLGAFGKNSEGIDYEQEKALFFTGKAAMDYNAAYAIGEIETAPVAEDLSVFATPGFADKPELKGDYRETLNAYFLSNKLTDAEKDAVAKFVVFVTSAEAGLRYATEAKSMVPRTDVHPTAEQVGRLYTETAELGKLVTNPGLDVFAYDPLPSMQDVTRNAAVGILTGNTAQQAAQQIQDEVDSAS